MCIIYIFSENNLLYICVCVCTYIYISTHTHVHIYIRIHIYVWHIYVYIIHISKYIYKYIYKYIHIPVYQGWQQCVAVTGERVWYWMFGGSQWMHAAGTDLITYLYTYMHVHTYIYFYMYLLYVYIHIYIDTHILLRWGRERWRARVVLDVWGLWMHAAGTDLFTYLSPYKSLHVTDFWRISFSPSQAPILHHLGLLSDNFSKVNCYSSHHINSYTSPTFENFLPPQSRSIISGLCLEISQKSIATQFTIWIPTCHWLVRIFFSHSHAPLLHYLGLPRLPPGKNSQKSALSSLYIVNQRASKLLRISTTISSHFVCCLVEILQKIACSSIYYVKWQ